MKKRMLLMLILFAGFLLISCVGSRVVNIENVNCKFSNDLFEKNERSVLINFISSKDNLFYYGHLKEDSLYIQPFLNKLQYSIIESNLFEKAFFDSTKNHNCILDISFVRKAYGGDDGWLSIIIDFLDENNCTYSFTLKDFINLNYNEKKTIDFNERMPVALERSFERIIPSILFSIAILTNSESSIEKKINLTHEYAKFCDGIQRPEFIMTMIEILLERRFSEDSNNSDTQILQHLLNLDFYSDNFIKTITEIDTIYCNDIYSEIILKKINSIDLSSNNMFEDLYISSTFSGEDYFLLTPDFA